MARPLVLGEDPGLTANLSDPWGMVLTLLWLVAAAGWAFSRGSWIGNRGSKNEDSSRSTIHDPRSTIHDPRSTIPWYGGLVETALLALVALVFVSAEVAARYKFPARLIAWEWFGLFVAFFVVRQLAVSPTEQRGLFAVVLAGAVSLAAQGIYQEFVELPRDRRLAEDPEQLRAAWAEQSHELETSESFLEQLRHRALERNIYGPYAHPNSYAGYLALWLPGLIGAVVACRRMKAANWQVAAAIGFAALGAAALWLTHSRGAMLGLILAGLAVAVLVWRRWLRGHWLAALAGAVVLAGLSYGVSRSDLLTTGMGKTSTTAVQRLQYWRTTWYMIAERPWLGVGPGNFRENYSRLMPPDADEKVSDPHNFVLEIWSTCGVFALLALSIAVATFFVRLIWGLLHPPAEEEGAETPETAEVRWEFYVGGMIGLLLGFVLRANGLTSQAILGETWAALLRAVVWFAAFGLLERLDWTARGRALVLGTGVAALLLNLCVSGGIGFPSVAGPLWVAAALALNAVALRPIGWLSRPGAAVILPLPLFIGLALGYGIYILYPVVASYSLVQDAFISAEALRRKEIKGDPIRVIRRSVLGRLEAAARQTPGDARVYVQLAWWHGVLWYQLQRNTGSSDMPIATEAIRNGMQAVHFDPEGGQGYWVQYILRTRFFAGLNEELVSKGTNRDPVFLAARREAARHQYELAAKALADYLPYDPSDAVLRFQLARAWFQAGETFEKEAREQAEAALRLDEVAVSPTRKLADPQRKQVQEWLSAGPPG